MKEILKNIENEISKREITEEEISETLSSYEPVKNRRIIGGYSSVSVIDREGHRITIPALKNAVAKFMSDPNFRPCNVFHCLTPETKILVCKRVNRYLPISELNPGDKVYTHLGNLKRINKVIVHENDGPINELILENGEIINVTDEHPILTKRGWIKAYNLLETDILITTSPYYYNSEANFNKEHCKEIYNNKTKILIHNGTKIISIKRKWYKGKVYNLEVEDDHTYSGKGIIYHNSDITIGRIIPKWTNPETGETLTTHVDDNGWYTLVEVRSDIDIANKVWDEMLAGRIKSFSIAGSSKDKSPSWEGGQQHTAINDLEIYETTACLLPDEKIWTSEGLKEIQKVTKEDFVLSHKLKWKKIISIFSRKVNEELIEITTTEGKLVATSEHPIRVLKHFGRNLGTKYIWDKIENIKVGDEISYHYPIGYCNKCNKPIFTKKEGIIKRNRKYCSYNCRFSSPGNRLGSHYKSKLNGITKKENPNLSGGFKTEEGKIKQILAHQTPEFRQKRKEIQTNLWKDAKYKKNQTKKIHSRRKELGTYDNHSKFMKNLWSNSTYVKKMLKLWKKRPNKLEQIFNEYLQEIFPNEWKYVGCGDFLIESKNPDFININGQKKIIELNGEYWHKNVKETKNRVKLFKLYGYETLIVSDKELKKDLIKCLSKIKEFAQNKLSKVISIKKVYYEGLVYNIEVEEDNSYSTEFAVVHNCEEPVNQLSKFDILWDPDKITI